MEDITFEEPRINAHIMRTDCREESGYEREENRTIEALTLLVPASTQYTERGVLSTNIVQTRQAGSLLTVDIQTSFHLIIGILDMEVAPIQSAHCADWRSKHLSVRISRCPPPGYFTDMHFVWFNGFAKFLRAENDRLV